MLKNKYISALFGMLAMLIILAGLYLIPEVKRRVDWRMDEATTYMRVVLNPIKAMPSPVPVTLAAATATPTEDPAITTPEPVQTTRIPPTPTLTPTALPSSASLQAPEYERQGTNNCGPAALSTYLRYYQWDGNQDDIASVLKSTTADRNVNVEELDYYTKNFAGWLHTQYRVGGDIQLLKTFIANGIPVLIEESMQIDKSYWPNDDRWAGHYLFLNGYNDATQTFVSQDTYYGPDMAVSYSQLEKNWQSFNHVYILVYRPDQEELVKEILGENWDVKKNRELAIEAAEEATQDEPDNPFHWFNLGTNLVYFDRYGEASAAYDQARKIGLPQRMMRYQFGPFLAYFNALRTEDLLSVAEYAVTITPNSEEARLWLGWAHFRNGDRLAAESEFRKALEENYNYSDAQYALNYIATN
jgi:hypothetical protein